MEHFGTGLGLLLLGILLVCVALYLRYDELHQRARREAERKRQNDARFVSYWHYPDTTRPPK